MALPLVRDQNFAGDALIVAKFGGSSVKDASAMQSCAKVLEKFPAIKVAILSATYNTTNELEMLAALAGGQPQTISGKEITANMEFLQKHLVQKHTTLARDLGVEPAVQHELAKLFLHLQTVLATLQATAPVSAERSHYLKMHEQIYATGELLSTAIFAAYLKKVFPHRRVVWLDSRQYLVTDDQWTQANVDGPRTQQRMAPLKKELTQDASLLYVAQGFIGATAAGDSTTLGREGSDLSAAVYAAALAATALQIWTDVPGIASADPKRVRNVRYLSTLSYQQANWLSSLGAKVLHHKTLYPVMQQQIPVWVGQTTQPAKGTRITATANLARGVLAVQPVLDFPLSLLLRENGWGPMAEEQAAGPRIDGIYLLGDFDQTKIAQTILNFLKKKKIPLARPLANGILPLENYSSALWPYLPVTGGGLLVLERSLHEQVLEGLHRLLMNSPAD